MKDIIAFDVEFIMLFCLFCFDWEFKTVFLTPGSTTRIERCSRFPWFRSKYSQTHLFSKQQHEYNSINKINKKDSMHTINFEKKMCFLWLRVAPILYLNRTSQSRPFFTIEEQEQKHHHDISYLYVILQGFFLPLVSRNIVSCLRIVCDLGGRRKTALFVQYNRIFSSEVLSFSQMLFR